MNGWPVRHHSISSSPWTTPPRRSTRPSWSRRRAPRPPSARSSRCSPPRACPVALYTDRGSHYFHTPEAGGKVDKSNPTQVGRALHQLSIEHIAAYSPQARGRSERAFGTLQDRLVKELSLAGITEIEAANPLHRRELPARPQPALRNKARTRSQRLRVTASARPGPRGPVPAHKARGRARQHRAPRKTGPPNPRQPGQTPLRQGHGPGCTSIQTAHSPSSTDPDASPAIRQTASPSTHQSGRPREPLRRSLPAPCGQVDSRSAPDHFPTGPTATTEADNRCATETGQIHLLATPCGSSGRSAPYGLAQEALGRAVKVADREVGLA